MAVGVALGTTITDTLSYSPIPLLPTTLAGSVVARTPVSPVHYLGFTANTSPSKSNPPLGRSLYTGNEIRYSRASAHWPKDNYVYVFLGIGSFEVKPMPRSASRIEPVDIMVCAHSLGGWPSGPRSLFWKTPQLRAILFHATQRSLLKCCIGYIIIHI